MKKVRLVTPARLHFGLFGWGPEAFRQFGGFGLMINRPGFDFTISMDEPCEFESVEKNNLNLTGLVERIKENLRQTGATLPEFSLKIDAVTPAHHGLGSGTQRALALAEILAIAAGRHELKLHELADLAGRHPRSGVGAYGYFNGGLIVDGGHKTGLGAHRELAPTICRMQWPIHWKIVLLIPQEAAGTHGDEETRAFAELPAPPVKSMNLVTRTTLTAFLPAVAECDFISAMTALETVQHEVGQWFAPAQGNSIYGSSDRDRLVHAMKSAGLHGAGQSSWGPTLFGFSHLTDVQIRGMVEQVRQACPEIRFQSIITEANNTGRQREMFF